MVEISTSVLNVEEKEAIKIFYNLETGGTDYYHIDVMDGYFVKKDTSNLMYSYANAIKQISNIPLDVHLMVSDVKSYINQYLDLEPYFITIHYESCKNKEKVREILKYIKHSNVKCGLSIKPDTKVSEIYEFLEYINVCLIMSVEPGEGGQEFIRTTVDKIKELKDYLNKNNLETFIEVDGGININTAKLVKEAGADILVSGTAIINSDDYEKTIEILKQ